MPRFIALSYTWGENFQGLTLRTENIQVLQERDCLRHSGLSRTIEDSTVLVEKLGGRYLWVDVLCVLQDDPQDPVSSIPQMHLIYRKARLTVVAASGSNADAGLLGMRDSMRSQRHIIAHAQSYALLSRLQVKDNRSTDGTTLDYLKGTTYKSRAWAMQELLLSSRCLALTPEQVYRACPCAT